MAVPTEKIALFIDGANLYATAKTLGFDIDYKRLLREFQSRGYLLRAFYYTAVIEDQEYSSIRPLIDWLDYNGYTVVTKATKEFVDQSGRRKVKGTWTSNLRSRDGDRAACRSHRSVLRRWRFPLAGRGDPAQGRAGDRRLHHFDAAADGGRRVAPPSRYLPRYRRTAKQDRPRSGRACIGPPRDDGRARIAVASAASTRSSCSARWRRNGPAPRTRTSTKTETGADAAGAEPPRDCPLCPRLVAFREQWRAKEPDWFNAPVHSFGPLDARLLIVGLAPGLRGANRTGRPFTGDYAGDLLYETLTDFGFARGHYDERPDDGLTLVDARITNAVHCVPPENKPTPAEIKTCRDAYLAHRFAGMPNLRAIVMLGRISHEFDGARARTEAFRGTVRARLTPPDRRSRAVR